MLIQQRRVLLYMPIVYIYIIICYYSYILFTVLKLGKKLIERLKSVIKKKEKNLLYERLKFLIWS